MIVIDASAMTEFLLQTPLGLRVESRLLRDGDGFHTPHLRLPRSKRRKALQSRFNLI
jgi:hypothetical protein